MHTRPSFKRKTRLFDRRAHKPSLKCRYDKSFRQTCTQHPALKADKIRAFDMHTLTRSVSMKSRFEVAGIRLFGTHTNCRSNQRVFSFEFSTSTKRMNNFTYGRFHTPLALPTFHFYCTGIFLHRAENAHWCLLSWRNILCLFFILVVSVRKCSGKHSCMSFTFFIAILNGTLFFARRNNSCFNRSLACQKLSCDNNNNNSSTASGSITPMIGRPNLLARPLGLLYFVPALLLSTFSRLHFHVFFFVLFHSYSSYAQVLGTTFVYEFHIS